MKHEDRKKKYEEYIQALCASKGVISGNILELRKAAFDVTEGDILELSDIISQEGLDAAVASDVFSILTEDLRDLRDKRQICGTRADIIMLFSDTTDKDKNKDYIFVS